MDTILTPVDAFASTDRTRAVWPGRILTAIAALFLYCSPGISEALFVHLRVGNPLLSRTLFPIYVGTLVWFALYLRDDRVRLCSRRVTASNPHTALSRR
jgi:hypothetical protein